LPHFDCPNKLSEIDYIKQLAREGWVKLLTEKNKVKDQEKYDLYGERCKYELKVIEEYDLAGYFLIMRDLVTHFRKECSVLAPGRGCLVNSDVYLSDGSTKDISDITIGDKIITNDGNINKVTNKFEYDINENILNFKTWFGAKDGINLTKDHKVLSCKVEKYKSKGKSGKIRTYYSKKIDNLEWNEAQELEIGDYIVFPKIKRENKEIIFDLSNYTFNLPNGSKSYIENEKCITYKTGNKHRKSEYLESPKNLILNEDFAYVLGVFVGDGWFSKNKSYVSFCFHSKDNHESEKKVIDYMTSIGCVYSRIDNQ